MIKHHINEQDWVRVSYDPRVPEGLHMTNTGDPSPRTGGLGGWEHKTLSRRPGAARRARFKTGLDEHTVRRADTGSGARAYLVRHAAHDSKEALRDSGDSYRGVSLVRSHRAGNYRGRGLLIL